MTVTAIIPTSIDVSPSFPMNDAGDRWLATANADASVSVSVMVTRPFPALVGSVNMGPEPRNIVSAVERHQGSLR